MTSWVALWVESALCVTLEYCLYLLIFFPPEETLFGWNVVSSRSQCCCSHEKYQAESLVSSGGICMFVNTLCGCWNQWGPALQTFRRWIFIKSGFFSGNHPSLGSFTAAVCCAAAIHVIEFRVFFPSVGIPLWAKSRSMDAVCVEAADVFTCTAWYLQTSLLLITEQEPQKVNEMRGQHFKV